MLFVKLPQAHLLPLLLSALPFFFSWRGLFFLPRFLGLPYLWLFLAAWGPFPSAPRRGGEFSSSLTFVARPHNMILMRPLLIPWASCSSLDRALIPCFQWMLTSRPKEKTPLLGCGKYNRQSESSARKNASSRLSPKLTPTVMFWFFARWGLNALRKVHRKEC